jgi:SAM-dependent methyltransferase
MQQRYNPAEYWERRLAQRVDITTVGHIGLGRIYNEWLYRARFTALRRAIRTARVNCEGRSLLDVGVGGGAYIPFWKMMGVKEYVGVDITSTSIMALRDRYPEWKFIRADISDLTTPDKLSEFTRDGFFDIVTLFDLLFHIVDGETFIRAITNVSHLVKAGGYVLISDSFCSVPWGPFYHEYHRPYQDYAQHLLCNSLQIIHIQPIFVIMTPPLYSDSRRGYKLVDMLINRTLGVISRLTSSRATEWVNHFFGATLYAINLLLLGVDKQGRSLKYLVVRKNKS